MVETTNVDNFLKQHKVKIIICGVIAGLVLIAGVTALVIFVLQAETIDSAGNSSNLGQQSTPDDNNFGKYSKAAVSCDAPRCAQIGRKILEAHGTVADAAIATLLCMGVIHTQSMGVGGGFMMVYYNQKEGKSYVMNARERAPGRATKDMFHSDPTLSANGGLSVGVPGELKGYWELYKKYGGGVPWKTLFEPTIKICEDGFEITNHTAKAIRAEKKHLVTSPSMKAILIDPATGDFYKSGDIMRRPQLAKTFRRIAEDSVNGGDLLYQKESELAQWLVEDLRKMGGIMTIQDLVNYRVSWDEPIKVKIHEGFTVHTTPPPSGGVLLAFILRILDTYKLTLPSTEDEMIKTYHLILEAFKHAYAQRTKLGDPSDEDAYLEITELVEDLTTSEEFLQNVHELIKPNWTSNNVSYYGAKYFQRRDHGTSHVSVVGPNGDAIAITSTVNLYFGANIRSNRTGIIYNDQMDDFSAPNITNAFGVRPCANNFIKPAKRPMSSTAPTIITDKDGRVRLAIGTAGGTRIATATAYATIRNLWFKETIKEAIDAPRLHHQLSPMKAQYEPGLLSEGVIEGLKKIGHEMAGSTTSHPSITMGIARAPTGDLWANCDRRKTCSVDGF